jgi:SnoaL-like protein
VLFGTAAANLDRAQTVAYLAQLAGQEGTIRWEWGQVLPLFNRSEVLVFAAIGTVGLDDAQGRPVGEREPFRLTCVAVAQDGHWRLRHFHGSVPEKE